MPRGRRRKINPGRRLKVVPTDELVGRLYGRTLPRMTEHSPDGCECWEWQGYTDDNGYGRIWVNGRSEWTHRVSYAAMKRTIPAGREIDHECHNSSCVFPGHLIQKGKSGNSREGALWKHRKERGRLAPRRLTAIGRAAELVAASLTAAPF